MTTAVQHRRGTTAEHSTFTGLEGEVTIDTTKDTAVIHDGSLAGGYPLAKETLANVNPSTLSAITGAATASDDLFLMYDTSALAMKKISRAELNNAITIEALDTVDINGGTIDGTAIGGTTPAAGAFTTLSASGSVTLSGGTANGVAYLDGSKVLTSGSALTFDGTSLYLGDNNKAIFGAGSDLQIYHSGSVSYIKEVGAGGLYVDVTNDMYIRRGDTSALMAEFNAGVAKLYFDNSLKLATTATGIDVTGLTDTDTLSVSGNTTLGDASTDTVTVNGYMGVGGAASSDVGVYITSSSLVGSSQYGIWSGPVANTSATSLVVGALLTKNTAAASFTTSNAISLRIGNGVKGAGSTITSNTGIEVLDQTNGTNNYGITSLVSSGTNKWNIYASGTAANYFAGNVGIGTSSPTTKLYVTASAASTACAAFFNTDTANGNGVYIKAGGANAGKYALAIDNAASSSLLYLDSSGNLGIGTSSPVARLHVEDTSSAAATALVRLVGQNTYQMDIESLANGAGTVGNRFNFAVNSSGGEFSWSNSGGERLRIDSSGYLRLSSNSGGIQFNGDTAAANALDDYEEGTWTPILSGSASAPTVTYAAQTGSYTKIGRLVTVRARIVVSTISGGSGYAVVSLPFTTLSGVIPFEGAVRVENMAGTAYNLCVVETVGGSTNCYFRVNTNTTGAGANFQVSNFTANSNINFTLTYFVS